MEAAEQIRKLEEFIEATSLKELMKAAASGARSLVLDFIELSKFDPDVAEQLLEQPEEVIRAAELAISSFDLPEGKRIRVRITNLPAQHKILIRNIRAEHLNKLLLIEGTVRQKSDVRPQVIAARFECPSCGNIMNVLQLDNKFKEPSRCGCGRKGKFKLLSKELVDAQGIVLEESTRDLEGGEQPKRMNVLLKDELVSPISEKRTNPGSSIRVIGLVKEVPIILRTGGQSTKFDLIIEANHVEALEEDYTNIEITKEDEKQIFELAKDKRAQEKLIQSLAPGIYGHERIKEAMLLQFVGGVRKSRTDGVNTRGDIHLLLIGDPGSGKSMLLKRAAVVAPKARYVSGKGVSGAGLTASVVRDEFLSGWSLEAGALVLANRGVVMIDELDKMSNEDRAAMHEGLEQQSYHHDFGLMFSDGSTEKIGDYVDRLMEQNPGRVMQGNDCEILELGGKELLSTDFRRIHAVVPKRVSRHRPPAHYVRVTFSNGRAILVTPEHPLFVYNRGIKEIPAVHAKPGMIVPAARKLCIKGSIQSLRASARLPKALDSRLATLLGYIASEGYTYFNALNRSAEVGVSNTDPEIVKECAALFRALFGLEPNIAVQKGRKKATKDQYLVRCSSKTLFSYFNANFPELMAKAKDKSVPLCIRKSKAGVRAAFLRAYFAGDGFIDSERTGFATASYAMACGLQDLLLCEGIWSYIATEDREGAKYHKVVVSGTDSLRAFIDKAVRKDFRRTRIERLLARSMNRRNSRDIVPSDVVAAFNSFLRRARSSDGYFATLVARGQNSHREVMLEYLQKAKLSSPELRREASGFQAFLCSELRYITIKKVERVTDRRFRWVYDVTVEPTRTFISQGMVLHNTVSISKANIQATLRCETTVLAAANPKLGRFDPYETIARQIDLPPTLINRFDLIFTIKDLPDAERDEKMASFILDLHQSLGEGGSEIPTDLLRKYLVYCRQKLHPKLTDAALLELKDYYVKMRTSGSMEEGAVKTIPISARQLEALVRLAEAAAKLRLSDKVMKRDAKRAIALLHYCLEQVGMDPETGRIDIDRITTGIPTTERGKIINVREIIGELEEKFGKAIPIEDVVAMAVEKGLSEDDVDEAIEKLKRSGDLFEPKKGFISKI